MAFKVTTTGTAPLNYYGTGFGPVGTVVIHDLGQRRLVHPVTLLDLELEFTSEELYNSTNLQSAIAAGHLNAFDQNNIQITAPDFDKSSPHSLGDHIDTIISSPVGPETNQSLSGQNVGSTITYTGTNWVNTPFSYRHVQGIASTSWTVVHNLGRYPSAVTVVDSGDTIVEGAVTYNSLNQLTIDFSSAFGGKAYIV